MHGVLAAHPAFNSRIAPEFKRLHLDFDLSKGLTLTMGTVEQVYTYTEKLLVHREVSSLALAF